jgi:hypothetical protein
LLKFQDLERLLGEEPIFNLVTNLLWIKKERGDKEGDVKGERNGDADGSGDLENGDLDFLAPNYNEKGIGGIFNSNKTFLLI